ncbi:MAG: signal peptidase I [Candidatus Tyrphobacter sp.]
MAVAFVLVVLLLGTFVVRFYSIPSISMIPTLQVNDTVLVDVASYRLHGPRAGDIVVFMPPVPSHGLPFIKRVVGVPGDRIRIADGVLYRNGKAIAEPYANEPPQYDLRVAHDSILVDGTPLPAAGADIPPRRMWQVPSRIPAGFYLVLGDNRNYSDDSHLWGFAQFGGAFVSGPLSHVHAQARLIGRAILVLWPPGHAHLLE